MTVQTVDDMQHDPQNDARRLNEVATELAIAGEVSGRAAHRLPPLDERRAELLAVEQAGRNGRQQKLAEVGARYGNDAAKDIGQRLTGISRSF